MKLHFSILIVVFSLSPSREGFSPELLLHRIIQPHSPLLQVQCQVRIRGAQLQSGRWHLCCATQPHLQACHSMNDKAEPSPGWFPINSFLLSTGSSVSSV